MKNADISNPLTASFCGLASNCSLLDEIDIFDTLLLLPLAICCSELVRFLKKPKLEIKNRERDRNIDISSILIDLYRLDDRE